MLASVSKTTFVTKKGVINKQKCVINAQQFYSPLTERLRQAGRGTNPRIQFNCDKNLLMLASDFYKTFVKKSVNDNLYCTYIQQFKIIEYGGPGVLTIYMRKPEILIYRTWAIVYFFLACSRLQDSVAQRS